MNVFINNFQPIGFVLDRIIRELLATLNSSVFHCKSSHLNMSTIHLHSYYQLVCFILPISSSACIYCFSSSSVMNIHNPSSTKTRARNLTNYSMQEPCIERRCYCILYQCFTGNSHAIRHMIADQQAVTTQLIAISLSVNKFSQPLDSSSLFSRMTFSVFSKTSASKALNLSPSLQWLPYQTRRRCFARFLYNRFRRQ